MTADQQNILDTWILEIKNEAKWYHAAHPTICDGNWIKFRYVSTPWTERKIRTTGDSGITAAVTRILAALWEQTDGDPLHKMYQGALKVIAVNDRRDSSSTSSPIPGSVWDTSFIREDSNLPERRRHGMPWMTDEYAVLKRLFFAGRSLRNLCETLQRPANGVIAKLKCRGYIVAESSHSSYAGVLYRVAKPKESTMAVGLSSTLIDSLSSNYPQPKEPPMNAAIPIETITYVYGQDVKGMTEAQLIAAIKQVEKEIGLLSDVKSKSKKIAAKIAEYEKTLADIVAVLDAK